MVEDARSLLSFKPLFDTYVTRQSHELSCYHFSAIFLWQDFFEFSFEESNGYLLVFARHAAGTFLYLPPLGPSLEGQIIDQAFNRLYQLNNRTPVSCSSESNGKEHNQNNAFIRIENFSQAQVEGLNSELYKITKKSDEYCYRRKDLVELRGNAYKSKRASNNQFLRLYSHVYEKYDSRWEKECLELYLLWEHSRSKTSTDVIYQTMLEENRKVHALILSHYQELELVGRVVLIDGKLQGYTFGYMLNPSTFCVLVEIVNLDIKGISTYIFSRFCDDGPIKDVETINVMDDFAMENMTRTKMSYRPQHLTPSYVITLR